MTKASAQLPVPLAVRIAQWVDDLQFAMLPSAVVQSVGQRMVDTVGNCFGARREPFARATAQVVEEMGGQGQATAVGLNNRLPAANAALYNGTLAHGSDYDDTHYEGIIHASSVIIPTALAVGETVRASGAEVITAAAAGYEVACRLGAAAPGAFHARGFHATAVCGTLAAAVVAGKLLGLEPQRLAAAMGIAGSQAGGLFEYLADGSSVKRLHPGWAAHSGILAAMIARGGFTGPKTVLEGRHGLYRTFLAPVEADLQRVVSKLGVRWETMEISFKLFPCCHFIQGCLESADALRDAVPALGAVERVVCHVPTGVVPIVCEPVSEKLKPRTDYNAKFSLQFSVAAMLVEGQVNLATYTPTKLEDAAILNLTQRIEYSPDPHTDYPRNYPGRVQIYLHDGRVLDHATAVNCGTRQRPLSTEQLHAKFRANASHGAVSAQRVQQILTALEDVERAQDIGAVGQLLGRL